MALGFFPIIWTFLALSNDEKWLKEGGAHLTGLVLDPPGSISFGHGMLQAVGD
jgi:hypothetical protein